MLGWMMRGAGIATHPIYRLIKSVNKLSLSSGPGDGRKGRYMIPTLPHFWR